jgi:hypothetical protein
MNLPQKQNILFLQNFLETFLKFISNLQNALFCTVRNNVEEDFREKGWMEKGGGYGWGRIKESNANFK